MIFSIGQLITEFLPEIDCLLLMLHCLLSSKLNLIGRWLVLGPSELLDSWLMVGSLFCFVMSSIRLTELGFVVSFNCWSLMINQPRQAQI